LTNFFTVWTILELHSQLHRIYVRWKFERRFTHCRGRRIHLSSGWSTGLSTLSHDWILRRRLLPEIPLHSARALLWKWHRKTSEIAFL